MYAAQRLRIENSDAVPPIKVYAHPHTHFDFEDDFKRLPRDLQKAETTFRVGMFGWVAESKRVSEAIEALGLALDRLPAEASDHIELYVVGQLPPAGGYNPVQAAAASNVTQNVRFLSYVENKNFELLFRTCDCILNLRFPSCGETSGTLALAHSADVQVIKSNYQAMHEEVAPMAVTTLPFFEVASLASLIATSYLQWASGEEKPSMAEHRTSFGCPVEKAVLLEVTKHRILSDSAKAGAPRRAAR
jgi:glycosyltransferase involved in cell wall biosynthesis